MWCIVSGRLPVVLALLTSGEKLGRGGGGFVAGSSRVGLCVTVLPLFFPISVGKTVNFDLIVFCITDA